MKLEEIDDIYELSPLQQGMLLHSLADAGSGVYVLQFVCPLSGALDLAAFRRAWERMTARHSVLRTSFHWQELDKPLQVVHRAVELPLAQLDWRPLGAPEQESRLAALLREDRETTFDFILAPLMRLTLVRTGEESYRLVWTVHHILLDGWCLGLVLKEFLELYDGCRQDREVRLPAVRQYAEYIEWLQSRDRAETEAFWRRMLAGFSAPTPLAGDRPAAGAAPGSPFGEVSLLVPAPVVGELQGFAAKRQLTLSVLVQGAWARLLAQYSGKTDVLYGTVVSGRPPDFPGIESMIGLFVNSLPVRVELDPAQRLVAWLRDFQRLQLELRRFEHSSLVEVQGWSGVPRARSMFDSLVAFENYPRRPGADAAPAVPGTLRLGRVRTFEQTHYPLTFAVAPGRELSLQASFDRARFDAVTVRRMLLHLRSLLSGLVGAAERPVAEWSCLTAAERHLLLREWNDSAAPVLVCSALELLQAQVCRRPDALALACGAQHLSYGELDRRAARLAGHLRCLGVGPEVRVAICARRSPELIVAIAGVLAAGGAFVPLDPAYPADRLAFMVADAAAPVLLTQRDLLPALSELAARVVCLDGDLPDPPAGEASRQRTAPDQLAYVIYTSGSTGTPKGVAIPHGGLANLVAWHLATHGITAGDRLGQVASPAFDASVWEIWVALGAGASLHLADEAARLSPARLGEWLVESQVTSIFLPTPLAEAALAEPLPAALPLRSLLTGGDRLRRGQPATGFRLLNHYGPTEISVVGTCGAVPPEQELRGAPPIGRPIANTRAYLLDGRGELLPVGAAGEICLAGAGLARGYLGRPRLTAERFVPDPFAALPGSRLYRTGDLGRYLPDGELDFLGRLDRQVKVRGFRIEPGEIEAALVRHAGVSEAVVVEAGNGSLAGYVVRRQDAYPPPSELRAFLRQRLPEHMVPPVLMFIDRMPVTPNGKVDLGALPPPERAAAAGTAPRNELERTIAAAWQEVLGLASVGVDESFFDLGGHSLLVLQVHRRLERSLVRTLAITDLFRYPTIAMLAERLAREEQEGDASAAAGRERAEARRALTRRRQPPVAVGVDE